MKILFALTAVCLVLGCSGSSDDGEQRKEVSQLTSEDDRQQVFGKGVLLVKTEEETFLAGPVTNRRIPVSVFKKNGKQYSSMKELQEFISSLSEVQVTFNIQDSVIDEAEVLSQLSDKERKTVQQVLGE